MKHRRFSFPVTVLMMLALVALILFIGFSLQEALQLPDWVNPLIAMVMMITAFEFSARFGPQAFDTPYTQLLRQSRRDRVVLLVAFVVSIVIALPIGRGIPDRSGLAAVGFVLLGALAFLAICFIGGSASLRAQFKSDWRSNQKSDEHEGADKQL